MQRFDKEMSVQKPYQSGERRKRVSTTTTSTGGKRRLLKGPSRSNAGPKKTGRDVEGA